MNRRMPIVLLGAALLLAAAPWGNTQAPPPPPAPEAAPAPAAPAPAPEAAPAAPAPPPPPADIRQVQVQVWISETDENGVRKLGANLSYTRFTPAEFATNPQQYNEQNNSLRQVSTQMFNAANDFGTATLPAPSAAPPLAPGVGGVPTVASAPLRTGTVPSGFGMEAGIIASGSGTLEGAFRAIESKTDLDLISKPEILVVNGTVATIKAGSQVPYQSVTYPKGAPALAMAWRDVGVNMALQPTILPNDFVQLHLQQLEVSENTTVKVKALDLPVFSKRSQTGFVVVPSGQTLVIGGLSSRTVTKEERRVPLLGKIPVLGMAFRKRKAEADVRHLLVFVSPTVVDLRSLTEDAGSALEFWREKGSEWKHQEDLKKEIKIMQDEL